MKSIGMNGKKTVRSDKDCDMGKYEVRISSIIANKVGMVRSEQ